MAHFETENWPFVAAKWFLVPPTPRKVRVIVIHDMEFPERSTSAEDVARYFATTTTKASAHINVDNNSIVQCVKDSHVAFAAPGCNHDGIQIELAGYAKQKRTDWLDQYSFNMLILAANAAAQYCLKYTLPPAHLTDAELKSGMKGIVSHGQVSAVYKKSTHTDPGPSFPWDVFLLATRSFVEIHRARLL